MEDCNLPERSPRETERNRYLENFIPLKHF